MEEKLTVGARPCDPWHIGTHGRVLAIAIALCAALLAPPALGAPAPAAKAKPCKKGQVRKKGRCVKKPAKKKATPKPATPAPPVTPPGQAPNVSGPAVLNLVDFNKFLGGTRLYRKDAQGYETWDFCRNQVLNYHGEIPTPTGDVNVTDWQGTFLYSGYAYSQGDLLEGIVNYQGPDPARTQLVIDFYSTNTVAVLGTGPGEVAVYLRIPDGAQNCPKLE